MQAIHRRLLALALCAVCAAPAFAVDTDPPAKASDAVSARTTMRESGKIEPLASPKVQAVANANATRPGKGNWWADADIDGDGKLSAAEVKVHASLDARFSSIDADADGYVTNKEYRRFFASAKRRGEADAAALQRKQ